MKTNLTDYFFDSNYLELPIEDFACEQVRKIEKLKIKAMTKKERKEEARRLLENPTPENVERAEALLKGI